VFSFLLVFKPNFWMHFFYLLCLHIPAFHILLDFITRIMCGHECKWSNRRNGEGNFYGSGSRLVLTCSAPNNECCASRLKRQACQKHSDLPSCMLTSPSSIQRPGCFKNDFRTHYEEWTSKLRPFPAIILRFMTGDGVVVSCVWGCGILCGSGPFVFPTLVLFIWCIVVT
jgi:hypothetical protein